MRVNRAQLADVIGKTDKTIQVWLDEGLPRVYSGGTGTESVYDTAEVIRWMIARETGSRDDDGNVIVFEAERARLTKEQADKAAMQNDVTRGVLVDVTEVANHWGGLLTNCKTKLLAIPTKAAPMVIGSKSLPQVRETLEKFIREALHDLVSANPIPDRGGAAGSDAAAKPDGEPVGGSAPPVKRRKQRGAGPVDN